MKAVLITGGGRGLGKVTAARLAALGHRVLLTARDQPSADRAAAEIRRAHPTANVEARAVDLSSMAAVRAFGQGLCAEGLVLDVLFHCAGVMQQSPVRLTTPEGFEQTLAVNALAPFLLTHALLEALRRSAAGRVVNVTSRLHMPGSRGAPVNFDFDDPQLERGYDPDRAYKNSKLALLWFSYELHRRLGAGPLTVNAVCPGFVPTTAAESAHGFQRWLLRHVLAHLPLARSVEQAADAFCFMAVDPSLDKVSGQFYGDKQPLASSPESYDEAKAKRFWDLAAAATATGRWP